MKEEGIAATTSTVTNIGRRPPARSRETLTTAVPAQPFTNLRAPDRSEPPAASLQPQALDYTGRHFSICPAAPSVRRHCLICCAFLLAVSATLTFAADGVLKLAADAPLRHLAGHASFHRDASGTLELAGAADLHARGGFTPLTGTEVSGGFLPQGALWLHVRLAAPPRGETWWLEASVAFIDHITVHFVGADGRVITRTGGRAYPFEHRELHWHRHAFRLPAATDGYDVFVRYASAGTLRVAPLVARDDAYESYRHQEYLLQGAFFGIMGLVALLSLFRFARDGSPADGYYALYILSLETANIVLSGLADQLGAGLSLVQRHAITVAFPVLAGAALLGFLRAVIAWPRARRLDMNVVTGLFAALYLGGALLAWRHAPSTALLYANLGTGIVAILALGAGIAGTVRRIGNAGLFLLAFSPFLVVVAARLVQAFGLTQSLHVDSRVYMAATLAHALLLMAVTLVRDAGLARIRRELEWQIDDLRNVVSNQTLFMRMLAHEVRTPVAVVDTEAQLIERRLPAAAELRERTARIRASIARLGEVFARFVSQDHLASVRRIASEPVDLRALVGKTVAEAQSGTDRHLVTLSHAGLRKPIDGDATLLYAAVINLLENAIRYSPDGGAIAVRTATATDGSATVTVSDEGVGIPPQAQEAIFDRYYRTGQVKTAVGAGLGLYLVRSIARLHGGEVTCRSTLGEGSEFTLALRSKRS